MAILAPGDPCRLLCRIESDLFVRSQSTESFEIRDITPQIVDRVEGDGPPRKLLLELDSRESAQPQRWPNRKATLCIKLDVTQLPRDFLRQRQPFFGPAEDLERQILDEGPNGLCGIEHVLNS